MALGGRADSAWQFFINLVDNAMLDKPRRFATHRQGRRHERRGHNCWR
jgi:hypothetical protein